MNCEKCNQNPATIQLYMNINGKRVEMPLCASCYAEVRNQANFGAMSFRELAVPRLTIFSVN